MRAYRIILPVFTLILSATAAYTSPWLNSCVGHMRACYAAFVSQRGGTDPAEQARVKAAQTGFTASESHIAFPIALSKGGSGIILASFNGGQPNLISAEGYAHWSPQLSSDGSRLLFVRGNLVGERELVTCEIRSWQCEIIFRTNLPLVAPIDAGDGHILFATNAALEENNQAGRRFDIFSVRKGERPARLTKYEMYEVQSLSVSNHKIVFGADGQRNFDRLSCPPTEQLKCNKSDIFALDFDRQKMTMLDQPALLKPVLTIAGYSMGPIGSPNGRWLTFRNTDKKINPWRYNTIISALDGTRERRIPIQGIAFSPGAFVDDTFFVNEIFEGSYKIHRIEIYSMRTDTFDFTHSRLIADASPVKLSFNH